MLVMVLGLTGELFAGTKKISKNKDLGSFTDPVETFTDSIKFERNGKTLFIDSDVDDVTLAGVIYPKNSKVTDMTIEAESDFDGIVSLTANNPYQGNIILRGGTVELAGSGKLGSGNFSGDIDLGSGANTGIFKQNSTADQTLSGVISGSGALVKDNTGTLTLTGNNTYSGGTTLTGTGTLVITGVTSAGTGSIVQTDANSILRFDTTGTIANNMTLYNFESLRNVTLSGNINAQDATYKIATGKDTILSGDITGTGKLSQIGADDANYRGTLTLSGDNDFEGDTEVDSVLNVGSASALSAQSKLKVNNDGMVKLNGFASTVAGLEGNGTIQGSAALTAGDENDATFSGILQDGTGAGGLSLTKKGSGKMTLSGANTFSGNTTLDEGSIALQNAQALGTGSLIQTDGSSELIFDTTDTIANNLSIYNTKFLKSVTLTGNITANNATYDIASGTTTTISGDISGGGGTIKEGLGTLVLSGTNTYTGNTEINAGTLSLSSSTSNNNIDDSVSIIVGADGTFDVSAITASGGFQLANGQTLAGTGDVIGATEMTSGSNLSAGNGGVGELSFLTSLDVASASTGSLLFDLGSAGTGDLIDVTGDLTIGSGAFDLDSFAFTNLGATSVTGTYTWNLLHVQGDILGSLGDNTTSTPFASIKSASFAISDDFIQLTMTVPEPSSTALLGLGGLMLALRRKRSAA